MRRVAYLLATVMVICHVGLDEAVAQCMLANPSFEVPGSGGEVFGGWNQFGVVGSAANATHGSMAAR
ncbi:MAG: hypothetical protein P8181_12845, partial [bacterium]